MGIEICEHLMPGKPQVAVFDTAFHQTMPEKAYMYAIPYHYYEEYQVRKYGFFGISCRYVSSKIQKLLPDSDTSRMIICHLGNGSNVCAVKDGKCIDTTMGLTPMEGVVMGTRSGSIDPAVVEFIEKVDNKPIGYTINTLNRKSGLLGICGHADMRDVLEAAQNGDRLAIMARDMMIYSVQKAIGAFVAALNGVDVIAFSAGIGQNIPEIRKEICSAFEYLGVSIDEELNNNCFTDGVVSNDDSKVKVVVVKTNEELVIARDTKWLIENL